MNIRPATACLLLALTLVGTAATADTIMPGSGAVDGWNHDGSQRRYRAADLYGHINGGAELFLELGFEELLVQTYARGGREIGLEVYRMDSALAALAIYLFKCGEETPWPEIGARNSSTRFQATILRGNCFILVNSFSGDETLRPDMAALAGCLLDRIPDARLGSDPFGWLPLDGRLPGSGRLVCGEYSLQSIYTFGQGDMLQLGGELFGAAAEYRADNGTVVTRIVVKYPDRARAEAAMAGLQSGLDPALTPLVKTDTLLLFQDWKDRFGLVKLIETRLDIRVNLAGRPE